jgi:integrase
MPKLTKRVVEGVKPAAGNVVVFDDQMPGFGVRVLPSGKRSYFVQYRNSHGRSRWFTIGIHGKVTVDGARKTARKVLDAVHDGKDPAAERRAFREAPMVSELLDRYIAEHVEKRNRERTRGEVKRLVERHIRPELGRQKVAAVTRQDVGRLHRKLADTPRQGNFVLAVCSKAFSLAEAWGMRPEGSNPCSKIERNPENARERFLSASELARLGATLRLAETEGLPWKVDERKATAKHLPPPENRRTVYSRTTTAAIELLLFTGCRLSEVINLRWPQVDFDAGIITLAETKTAKRPQVVAMNAPARQVLKELKLIEGSPWVLPMARDPERHYAKDALEAAWQKIRRAAELEDVRLHDLRHTVGTYAGQSGANAFLVRDLLRHKNLAMTGRYVNRAEDPVRALSDQVGERIAAGLAGGKAGDVMPLKRAGTA